MKSTFCTFCQRPAATQICGACNEAVCKVCVQNLSPEKISFLETIPEELNLGRYCPPCFDQKVTPHLQAYDQIMARAKNVAIFFKKQSKETRLFKRKQKPIQVTNCSGRDEAILRLAFLAVTLNFNTVIDVEVEADKVRNAGYQTSIWKCAGIPVHSNV